MKANIYTQYGPPSVLTVKTIARPMPQANEVLIRVHATTVNRTDCAMLRAKPFIMRFFTGFLRPARPILGTDFAGQITAIGENVTTFAVGDRVFGFNDQGVSSQAAYLTLAADQPLAIIPANVSYEQAAASLEGAHYAYNFIKKVAIAPGQKILVNGATGAIGSATVQLLKYWGAVVTAVGNTKNLALVQSLGATRVIDYTQTDFTGDTEKYACVFDTVGKSSFFKCKPLLQPGGVYISSELGWLAQNVFLALVTPWLGGKKVIFPIPADVKGSVALMKKLLEEGHFRPVIDRTYPLEAIADAYRYVETGEKTGNVVLVIGADGEDVS
jgi:NADPH:quinone reductase-like Zn-dependent oxidoreductase